MDSQIKSALKRAILVCLAITPEEATSLRGLIDEESRKEGQSLETATGELREKLAGVQDKLNRLTRGYLDEVIDRESYEAAKADLVLEKATLKRERERLSKTHSSYWNEPAKELVNGLESAGNVQTGASIQEIATLVQKVGTNRLITSKKVAFAFSEHYEFAACLLENLRVEILDNPSLASNQNWWSTNWCA